jgi:nuclear pore complex protein Nup188
MLAGSPLAVHSVDVGADLVRFCAALEARMLAALAPKEITLATLKEVEVTALFFSRLASTFGAQWQVSSPEGQMRCRVACVSFLRWFAAPQVVGGLRCPRKTRADETLAAKPPATRATQAWFQATARGDSVREPTSPLIGTAPHGSPIADASTRKTGNAYSEAVAVALYRAARAACDFLAVFPRAVDQAALGFDVTASLRDQCDALSCDDLTSSPANADESALVAALDGLKSAASKIERLEASSLKPSDARADGSPRPRVAASSPFA